ncbi:cupredoxin domain-containing protein [Candidatus Micrarchaeota archaeon]|nr:cupredoxin domain-containing protein [Candidatus Micrarchaeota archaeon]
MKIHEIVAALMLLGMVGILVFGIGFANNTEADVVGANNISSEEKQTIQIKVVNGYYEPREVRVKEGTYVRLELDPNTFVGCMIDFNIWGLGKRMRVSQTNNAIEFVADKPGVYDMSCNMGMGYGKFIVEAADGSSTTIENEEVIARPSCGCGICNH